MADPYATRAPDLSDRPSGPPPWADVVSARGATTIDGTGEFAEAALIVVHCRGIGTLAPIARLGPPLAVLLWLEHVARSPSADAANRLLERLERHRGQLLAIKQGAVGGPADRAGCLEIDAALVEAVLQDAGEEAWEQDPDFGYEVPCAVPGLDDARARALLPRLLYADHDRVYEHAELVAARQQARRRIADRLPGLDPRVGAASGWPPRPTSDGWRR